MKQVNQSNYDKEENMQTENGSAAIKFNRKHFAGMGIALLLIVLAIGLSKVNALSKTEPVAKATPPKQIIAKTVRVSPGVAAPVLKSTATVEAWQESQLAAQVSGRLVWLCDCLETGQQVEQGAVLAKIEAADYLVAVAQAKQALADAKQKIAEEKARSEQARIDWEQLNLGEPTELALRKPQLETANASLRRRELELQQANRNLKRTQIKAPYAGIITARSSNVGNFVSTGASIGTILNTDKVLVRFALSPNDVNKLDQENLEVNLRQSGSHKLSWPARIERIDSVIDPKTRLINVIAEVQQPFDLERHTRPLRVGSFVSAEFSGSPFTNVYQLPNSAVLSDNSVYVVDSENIVQVHAVEIQHRNPDSVLVQIPAAQQQALNVITVGQGAYTQGLKISVLDSVGGDQDGA
ncbi:MAG: efflux RND transporter periplasmic adaptor subunit [Gammaproteobacteria bacterium]|nr:efflux RND transporter periplasmic adaptor subunit [Gammaproteobacteria bacterium]